MKNNKENNKKRMFSFRTKAESVLIAMLFIGIAVSSVWGTVTMTDKTTTTDDSGLIINYEEGWITAWNATVDNQSLTSTVFNQWNLAYSWIGDKIFNSSASKEITTDWTSGWNASNVTLIRNSKGNSWSVDGTDDDVQIQAAIDDLGVGYGTVWIGSNTTITSPILLHGDGTNVGTKNGIILDFQGHIVTLGADCSFINLTGALYCTVRNMKITTYTKHENTSIISLFATDVLDFGDDDSWSYRVDFNIFENIVISNPSPVESGHAKNHNYTGIHLFAQGDSRVDSNIFRNIRISSVGVGIKLTANHSDSYINGNSFDDIYIDAFRSMVEFERVSSATGSNHNNFDNVKGQTSDISEWGFRNIDGSGNEFENCLVWDWSLAREPWVDKQYAWHIGHESVGTYITAGGIGTFSTDVWDDGNYTVFETASDGSLYEQRPSNVTIFRNDTHYFCKLEDGRIRYRNTNFRSLLGSASGEVNGGKIYLKSGTYVATSAIPFGSNYNGVTIEGENKHNTIIRVADGTTFTSSFGLFNLVNINDVVFRNLKFDANTRGSCAQIRGISITNCENITVDNCVFYDFPSDGSYSFAGITLWNGASESCKNIRISNNDFRDFTTAIYIRGGETIDYMAQEIDIYNNHFLNGTFGIYAINYRFVENISICSNTFNSITSISIVLRGVNFSMITGNKILNGGTTGISMLNGASNNTIMMNTIDATTGIQLNAGCNNNSIAWNNLGLCTTKITDNSGETGNTIEKNMGDDI